MKIAIMGLGGRGITYAHFIQYYGSELVAVCDTNPAKKEIAKQYGMPDDGFYLDENEFFAQGKIADALVIATMDTLHHRQALKALELGYDLLLEKPIAMTLQECEDIRDCAIKYGRKVVVCHVLRYAPFYMQVKYLLDAGEIGEIVCLDQVENIGFYHYAHSFCRGNWRNTEVSTPLIVAKNCHDTDMICWLIGKKCLSVSSIGSLKFFNKEHAPEGATTHCYTCPHKDTCMYSAPYIYTNDEFEAIAGLAAHGNLGKTKEEILKNLSDPNNLLGRCVFHCDNNLADNQVVNMQFEDGVVAQLKSLAFTNVLKRDLMIHGTKGLLYNSEDGHIIVEKLNGEKKKYIVEEPKGGYAHHGGGDVGVISQFIEYLETGKRSKNITDISDSVMGHEVAFLAEESRLNGGKVYELRKN